MKADRPLHLRKCEGAVFFILISFVFPPNLLSLSAPISKTGRKNLTATLEN